MVEITPLKIPTSNNNILPAKFPIPSPTGGIPSYHLALFGKSWLCIFYSEFHDICSMIYTARMESNLLKLCFGFDVDKKWYLLVLGL